VNSPSCLTLSTGSCWLWGRTRSSPQCDGEALSEGFDADRCAEALCDMILLLEKCGWLGTVSIENPHGSKLWALLKALLGVRLTKPLRGVKISYCMYGNASTKPTRILASACLGADWARVCDKSGACGAMHHDGSRLVHGSVGSFGPKDAPLPLGLAEGLNAAWRRHHCPLRHEDPEYCSLPLATVQEMHEQWTQRPAFSRPERPTPLSFPRTDHDGTHHTTTDSESEGGSGIGGESLEQLAGMVDEVAEDGVDALLSSLCSYCAATVLVGGQTPDIAGDAMECPPAAGSGSDDRFLAAAGASSCFAATVLDRGQPADAVSVDVGSALAVGRAVVIGSSPSAE
jgi:hypothetical protein